MKIVHVGYGHNYDDIRIFQKECQSLTKAGYAVTYVTSDKAGGTNEDSIAGVKIKVIKLINKRFLRLRQYHKDLFKFLLETEADVYHFHEFVLYPVANKLIRKGKKVIYDLHEDTPRQLGQNLRHRFGNLLGGLGERVIEKIENRLIRKADGTVTVVDNIVRRANQVGAKRVALVANYPIMESIKGSLPLEERENKICYCGVISEMRGAEQMVTSMEGQDGQLILAGPISDKLMERVINLKGWHNVEYRGILTKDGVDRIYSECVLGLCIYLDTPNNINSNPNKLFECMNAGIPIICSDFPLWKEIVEDGNCGICVKAEDVGQIKESIIKLLSNKNLSRVMGENGKRLVEEKYNWHIEEKKLLRLYADILK
jgi:glycosyltransferase involved in cell wall biosynthesis